MLPLAGLVGSCEEAPFTAPAPRGAEGACCLPDECSYTEEASCQGLFIKGVACDPDPCPSNLTACCADDGACAMREASACTLSQKEPIPDAVCSPNPCRQPEVGACCTDIGECIDAVDERDCRRDAHTFIGVDVGCGDDTCPEVIIGSCCLETGQCEMIDRPRCRGVFDASGTCDPNTCPPPPEGACCANEGTDCVVSNRFSCEARFMGPESACSVALCTLPTDAGPDGGDMSVDAGVDARASDGPLPDGPIPDGPVPDRPVPDAAPPDAQAIEYDAAQVDSARQ